VSGKFLVKTRSKTVWKTELYAWKRESEKLGFFTCQGGTIVHPCSKAVRVLTALDGTTVRPVGTTMPTPPMHGNYDFSYFWVHKNIPMSPKHLNLINWCVIELILGKEIDFETWRQWDKLWEFCEMNELCETKTLRLTN